MPDPLNDPARREAAVTLVRTFLDRVWGPSHDLGAIDDLMTEDYVITSGGTVLSGREAFRAWVAEFHRVLADARTVSHEEIVDATGTRVVSRWTCSGRNRGIFGLPADDRPIAFTGIAIWRVQDGRLAECWAERSALEAVRAHGTAGGAL